MTLLELQDVLGKAIVSIEDGTGSIDKAKAAINATLNVN